MKRAMVVAFLTIGVAACATLRGERGPSPKGQLRRGLTALAAHDYVGARPVLERLYLEHPQEAEGREALLALAAAELDSRNADRRLGVGAELAGRYLSLESIPGWTVPAAETLYLLAEELGEGYAELARADSTRQAAEAERADALQAISLARGGQPLPQSEVQSMPHLIRRLNAEHEEEVAGLQERVNTLQERLAAKAKELKDAQAELERIRRVLKR
jgi:chromosome segregation ATPase